MKYFCSICNREFEDEIFCRIHEVECMFMQTKEYEAFMKELEK